MKTTAIKKYNVAVTRQSGKVGNVRYVQRNGETYVRSAVNSKVTNRRTDKQMVQRMKWASLALFGAKMKDFITGAFANKQANQTYYNAFMQANNGLGVYVSQEQIQDKEVYALPAMISRGGLGTITCTIENGGAISNIPVGTLTISSSTTVADLALALISNGNWAYGDQLTILSCVQNGTDITVKGIRIYLDKTDTTLLSSFGTFSVEDGCLAYQFVDQGCIGFIHSNLKDASKSTMAASAEQETLIETMLSDDNYDACVKTFGTSTANYVGGSESGSDSTTASSGGSSSGSGSSTSTKYTLTLVASPSAGGTVSGAGQYTAGTTVTIKANALSGYKFSQWSDGNTSATRSVTVNSNLSLTATFVADAGASTVPEGGDGDEAEA